ncbi:MAG: hypothetical protein ACI9IL_000673 [Rickettsiales bacterium]|jgi:hypothetical protein
MLLLTNEMQKIVENSYYLMIRRIGMYIIDLGKKYKTDDNKVIVFVSQVWLTYC